MSTPVTEDDPGPAPPQSIGPGELARSGGPLPVTFHVGPQDPILGTLAMVFLGIVQGAVCLLWLLGPVRDGAGRLLSVWGKLGSAVWFEAGIVFVTGAVLTECLASCTVEFSPGWVRYERRIGRLFVHRTLPLAGIFSFELLELHSKGGPALWGRRYRLSAHTRELGEVTLIPNMDSHARAQLAPVVEALTDFVRSRAARPER